MTLATRPIITTLGDYAYRAIQKHFKKTLKWEKTVKKDEDPEALHQMRVGIRRLRSAVNSFEFVVDLPKAVKDRNLGKIGRQLGELRDLDVLKQTIETSFQPSLPPEEVKHLKAVFNALDKQRNDAVNVVKTTLKDVRYKSLKSSLNNWLEEPTYHETATLSVELILPELLLPEVSEFLLHPGWQFGNPSNLKNVLVHGINNSTNEKQENLSTNHEVLHSLRKKAKRLRYQMELFVDFYGDAYATYVAEVKNIQDILGEIHDTDVLEGWLSDVFDKKFTDKLPTFTNLLAEKRHQLWQRWTPIQERYLEADNRHRLHLAILHPISSPGHEDN